MSFVYDALRIVRNGKPFSIDSIAADINCTRSQAAHVVAQLLLDCRARVLTRPGKHTKSTYRVTEHGIDFLESGLCRRRARPGEPPLPKKAPPPKPKKSPVVKTAVVRIPMPNLNVPIAQSARRQPNSVFALGARA